MNKTRIPALTPANRGNQKTQYIEYYRLCVLNGPAMAFIPPVLAYKAVHASDCTFTEQDTVSADIWQGRLQEVCTFLIFVDALKELF